MAYKPDHYDRDRVTGIQIAKRLGATKTAAVISRKAGHPFALAEKAHRK